MNLLLLTIFPKLFMVMMVVAQPAYITGVRIQTRTLSCIVRKDSNLLIAHVCPQEKEVDGVHRYCRYQYNRH